MSDKCRNCPLLPEPGRECAGQRLHPRYCQLVDPAHPDHRPEYVGVVLGATPIPRREPRPAIAGPPPYSSREVAGIITCAFRWSDCNCLSKSARCSQAGYPAVVTFRDCLACVRSDP